MVEDIIKGPVAERCSAVRTTAFGGVTDFGGDISWPSSVASESELRIPPETTTSILGSLTIFVGSSS